MRMRYITLHQWKKYMQDAFGTFIIRFTNNWKQYFLPKLYGQQSGYEKEKKVKLADHLCGGKTISLYIVTETTKYDIMYR